jgi:hypothetical protein
MKNAIIILTIGLIIAIGTIVRLSYKLDSERRDAFFQGASFTFNYNEYTGYYTEPFSPDLLWGCLYGVVHQSSRNI